MVFPLHNAVGGPFLPKLQPSLHLRHYLRRKCESLLITTYWQWKLDARRLGVSIFGFTVVGAGPVKATLKIIDFLNGLFDYAAITPVM